MNVKTCAAVAAAVLAGAAAAAAKPSYKTLISHRGESVDAPENTLPAFKTAVERGFGFECDVYLSTDGRVFTFHDGNLNRTSGGKNKKPCREASWEEDLKDLDVGGWGPWKGSKFEGTRPALLEEVLELARDGRYIYVEVKVGPEIVPYIKRVFAKQSKATPANALFITFNNDTCRELKKQMPEYKVYWLTGSRVKTPDGDVAPVTARYIIDNLKDMGVDGVDCHYGDDCVTKELVDEVKAAGYEFHVWTVDSLPRTLEAFKRGAQTVTTNCARKQLREYKALKKAKGAAGKKKAGAKKARAGKEAN